eukprot:4598815-Lingulodinium_polyedra.AAC.1
MTRPVVGEGCSRVFERFCRNFGRHMVPATFPVGDRQRGRIGCRFTCPQPCGGAWRPSFGAGAGVARCMYRVRNRDEVREDA